MSHEIIIIDDDLLILMIHELVVKKTINDVPIETFSSGDVALNYLCENKSSEKYFLVLLDINMPEMNGWQFLDNLESRELNALIAVIILTSSVYQEDRNRSKSYRLVKKFVEKPLKKGIMEEIWRDYISHHPISTEN